MIRCLRETPCCSLLYPSPETFDVVVIRAQALTICNWNRISGCILNFDSCFGEISNIIMIRSI